VVVLFHGGFWRAPYTKLLMRRLAADCARRGWTAWNVEYRRVGMLGGGGGWPDTLLDAGAAMDRLTTVEGVDLSRVAVLGHSAGGQLALWSAGRHRVPAGAPGAGPAIGRVAVRLAVSMAGVVDLHEAARTGLGAGAVEAFLGGTPEEWPDRYEAASPASLLPIGVPQLLIHGTADETVPPSSSERYARRAKVAGDPVVCELVDGAGHRAAIDPDSRTWARAVAHLEAAFT
jgi:acetyl esterase/lipase